MGKPWPPVTDEQRFERHTRGLLNGWRDDSPAVYYARRGDLIKIGSSLNPRKRIRCLGGRAVLLATEAGGRRVEGLRQRQFASARLPGENEWFVGNDLALNAHIAFLREVAPPAVATNVAIRQAERTLLERGIPSTVEPSVLRKIVAVIDHHYGDVADERATA